MVARSSIDLSPHREAIIQAIDNGVPGVEIARRYGVSQSAISRYKHYREGILKRVLSDSGNDPSAILGRLSDLADSARIARKLSDRTGSPTVRARVISAELAVLDRLVKLSVDDTSVARLAQAAGPLVRTIQGLAKTFPTEVLTELGKHEALADLKTDLATALKSADRNES